MLSRPRALLLDLDGTLLDTPVGRDAARARTAAIVERDAGIPVSVWTEAEVEVAGAVWARLGDDWVHGRIPTAAVSTEILSTALSRVGASPSLAGRLTEVWPSASFDAARLFADARPLVDHARESGIACAVVTNGAGDTQRGALRATGLLVSLDYVAASAEHGVAKPRPELFRIALDRLGVEADAAWHVGDRLGDDVVGARAAGLGAIWLDRAGVGLRPGDPVPDEIVRDLGQVIRLIQQSFEDGGQTRPASSSA